MELPKLVDSREESTTVQGRRRVTLQGRPGSGKSVLGATLSEFCPTELPAKEWVNLEDTLWIPFDTNATAALTDCRLQVQAVPVTDIAYDLDNDLPKVLQTITNVVYKAVEDGKKLVVVDTPTKLDKMLLDYLEEHGPTTKSGARDSFGIWRQMVSYHQRFHTNLDQLPVDLVFCMHSKPRSESDLAERKARAAGVSGTADIRFDFMYEDCVNIYRRDFDFIFVTDSSNRGGKHNYKCHLDPFQGFEAKSRYRNTLARIYEGRELPFHLGEIYRELNSEL